MSGARVLIVEDEYLVAADIEATLEERGFRSVGIAPDLPGAIRLAGEKPDVALVDLHLRDGLTGPTIAERLVRDHGVVVLFVTANPRMVMEVDLPGVVGVLAKPCDQDAVAAAVDYCVGAKTGTPLPAPPAGMTLFR